MFCDLCYRDLLTVQAEPDACLYVLNMFAL